MKKSTQYQATLYIRCSRDLWTRVSQLGIDLRKDKGTIVREAVETYLALYEKLPLETNSGNR